MNSYGQYNLLDNPFKNRDDLFDVFLIWAGMPDIKESLLKIYSTSFASPQKQVILNWGQWGGGKTYAAYYFAYNRLQDIDNNRLVHFYLTIPKEGSNANKEFIQNIIDGYGVSNWKAILSEAVEEIGKENLHRLLTQRIRSEEFADAIIRFSDKQLPHSVLSRYIFDGLDKKELKQLGIARPLITDSDYVKFLSGLMIALTSTSLNRRIFLWIDELEDLIYYTSKQFKILSQIIRDFTDTVGEKITLFMNFTLSEGEEDTVKILLGDALWSRINQKIRFKDLTIEQGFTYCAELIRYHQINNDRGLSPFERETIETLLQAIPSALMTPREINKYFHGVLDLAMSRNVGIIDINLVNKYLTNRNP